MSENKQKILFLCTHNSARSQIAEGLINNIFGAKYKAYSAGIQPTHVSPYAVEVLKEIGVDISKQYSKHITDYENMEFDIVVTVCDYAKENCPFYPGKKIIHKSYKDPAAVDGSIEEILAAFRNTRDDIKNWLRTELVEK